MADWHLLTGEYPPDAGGVADYTHLLAGELAKAGECVHVWTPARGEPVVTPRVTVHPILGGFQPLGLARLHRGLARFHKPRLFVQYVPQAFGMRSMNLPFVAWLSSWRRGEVWTMFHEVALPAEGGWLRIWRARLTWLMARAVAARAERVFTTIPAWALFLRTLGAVKTPRVLPVCSNLPESAEPRRQPFAVNVGSFGTFGWTSADLLAPVLRGLLDEFAEVGVILVGRGASRFAARIGSPERVRIGDNLPAAEAASWLAGCDMLVQPYIDGLSGRRTTVMAGLALGVPVVSNLGFLSEPEWAESSALGLANRPEASELLAVARRWLSDSGTRRAIGQLGQALYHQRFSRKRLIETLLT